MNLIVGSLLALLIMILLNFSAGLAFLVGVLISSINFTTSGFITSRMFSQNKSSIVVFIGYIARLALVSIIAIYYAKEPLNLMLFITALVFHYISLVIYWFSKEKGSD
ncbi:hypothetical protein [Clostridium cavendishii]|uniref:hypothetical protein n=1 Tax=Clostridium cavendishii TaxID=349931 RepID=UPI0009339133|nr:hypothetical protein [Clostridium cavendishii]